MDTSKYIKKCPKCHADIEPVRHATGGDKAIGGITSLSGATIGFGFGGPIGAAIGAVIGYHLGKQAMLDIEDEHDQNQWFRYKCPNGCCEWKEKIHTNDHPDDPTWLTRMY